MFDKKLLILLKNTKEIIRSNFKESELNTDESRLKLNTFFGHDKSYYVAIVNPLKLQIYYFCKPACDYLGYPNLNFNKANLSLLTKILAKENMGMVYSGIQHFLSKEKRNTPLTLHCKVKRNDNTWREVCFVSNLLYPGDDVKGFITVSVVLDVQDYLKDAISNQKDYTNQNYQLSNKMLIRINQLSPREKEVLVRYCNEQTNEEIAVNLNVSEHTVRAHKRSIAKKLNSKSNFTLAKYALYIIANPHLMNGGKVNF